MAKISKQAFPGGVFAPIVTPFRHERIAYDAFGRNIRRYNETALAGYMPLGSNGEFQGLRDAEMIHLLRLMQQYKASDKIVVAGCGRESAYATVAFIRQAARAGLDYTFILAPHYFIEQMGDEALYRYYTYIADHSPIPVVIYNAPKFAAGILLKPDLIAAAARHPNIVAMKNSSLHPTADYLQAIPADCDFSLIAGNIKTFYPGLAAGAVGGVLSTASYLPEACCQLYACFRRGELQAAEDLHKWLNYVSSETCGRYGVAGVKLGMRLRGYESGELRLPLLPVPLEEQERIRRFFVEHEIIPS